MTKSPIILAVLFAVGSAFAQSEAGTASAKAPGAAPKVETQSPRAFVPVDVAPGRAAPSGRTEEAIRSVNPFNGKPMALEDLQRELELRKLKTSLLEEDLRNATINEDLKALPTRKQVETSQAETQIAREGSQKDALERDRRNAETADAAAKAEAAKRKKAEQEQERREKDASKKSASGKKVAAEPAPVQAAPQPLVVDVLSVTTVGPDRSALVSINGNVLSVANGEMTPLGAVSIDGNGNVAVGGRSQAVRAATIGRLRLSEQPASAVATAQPPIVRNGSSPSPTQPSVVPPPVPGAAAPKPATTSVASNAAAGKSTSSNMPSLQLPAGIQLVPAQ